MQCQSLNQTRNTRSNGWHSNPHDRPFLFLQEESRLWRAALMMSRWNLLFTQHHFWARRQVRFNLTPHHPKGSLPSDLLVLCGAPGVSWPSAVWEELEGDHRHDSQKSWQIFRGPRQRRVIPTWRIQVPLLHVTVLLPLCSLTFYLVRLYMLKTRPPLTTHLCRYNYTQAPWSYCNTSKNTWGPGEVLLIYEREIQSRAPIPI